eukprot:scaffold655949_cov71-Prasinocladus_malaysianus.AAC.1
MPSQDVFAGQLKLSKTDSSYTKAICKCYLQAHATSRTSAQMHIIDINAELWLSNNKHQILPNLPVRKAFSDLMLRDLILQPCVPNVTKGKHVTYYAEMNNSCSAINECKGPSSCNRQRAQMQLTDRQ